MIVSRDDTEGSYRVIPGDFMFESVGMTPPPLPRRSCPVGVASAPNPNASYGEERHGKCKKTVLGQTRHQMATPGLQDRCTKGRGEPVAKCPILAPSKGGAGVRSSCLLSKNMGPEEPAFLIFQDKPEIMYLFTCSLLIFKILVTKPHCTKQGVGQTEHTCERELHASGQEATSG